ncbi:E3 SUMO-protein ligase ZBED1-like [Anopheles arabiensis]|uniref:BED-type domain-containing protein n=2 Tax=Anopheles arabiensis TaxID=7173 RepID=A0A182I5B0_ANOAR|nr:E3 SUMO-protein ligase ZBED1-like [Anopheles arabiensis]
MSKPSRFISSVWKHFERLGDRAKCQYCQNTFSFSTGSTANLKRHLARKHPTDPLQEMYAEVAESEPSSPPAETNGEQTWDDGIEGILIPKVECVMPQVETKPKPQQLVSSVWKHYDRDGSSAKCHHCPRVISYSHGSTSNLKKHLIRKHPDASLDPEPTPGDELAGEQGEDDPSSPSQWSEGIEGIVVPKKEQATPGGKMYADIWNHYDRDGTMATCHYCYRSIAFSAGSTSNLKKHLTRKHPMVTVQSRPAKKRQSLERKVKLPQSPRPLNDYFDEDSILPAVGLQPRNRPKPTSSVWNHFDRSGTTAKCRICLRVLTYAGTTSNLRKHILRQHPTLTLGKQEMTRIHHVTLPTPPQCPDSADDTERPSFTAKPFVSGSPGESSDSEQQQPAVKPLTEARVAKMHESIALMICRGNHTFAMVEEEAFQALFTQYSHREFEMCSKFTFKRLWLPQVYGKVQSRVKAELATARAISLGVNSATSVNHESVLSVTAYFIDQNGKLSNALLDFARCTPSYGGENVAAQLAEVMKLFEIDGKVLSIVTDNDDASVTQAVETLNIPHVACFAHSIDPIVMLTLNSTIQGTLDEVRHVVAQIRSSAKARELVEDIENSARVTTLKLDVPNDWHSTLDMLGRFVACKEAILACLAELNIACKLEGKDWLMLEQSTRVLQELATAVHEVSADKLVTISKPCVLYQLLVHRLEAMALEQNVLMDVSALAATLRDSIRECCAYVRSSPLLTQSVMLDPRYKAEGFMQDEECLQKTYESLVEEIAALQSDGGDGGVPMELDKESEAEQSRTNEEALYQLFEAHKHSKHDGSALKVSAQYELDYYLKAKHLQRKGDPLEWWERNKHFYPNLYKLASKRLCTPAACVSASGCCAKAELECRERKNRLLPKRIQQMVFIKYNHHRYQADIADD